MALLYIEKTSPFSLWILFHSIKPHVNGYCCCCSVAQSCPTLCDPMDLGTPGLPVLHYLLEFPQVLVHWFIDAIESSHPLSPSSFAFNLSQHQGLFQWVGSSHQVAEVLEPQLSASVLPVNIQGWFPLGLTGLISLHPNGLSRVFSSITTWRYQFLDAQPSIWSNSHILYNQAMRFLIA